MNKLTVTKRYLATLFLFACLGTPSWATQTAYTNPLLTKGNADPCIISNDNGTH